ncbi:hypothetical protein VM98_34485, partial [Streptomyces rubellomurinus subsp. indigoferus]
PLPAAVLVRLPASNDPAPARAHPPTARVLHLLRRWLADPRTPDTRLVPLTRGAAAVPADGQVADLASAAVWGLVRPAHAEHPGRFALSDVHAHTPDEAALAHPPSRQDQPPLRRGPALVPGLA